MSGEAVDSESKVSGNQANIPAHIRRELGIDDGDRLRWQIEDDGTLRVHVVRQRSGTFSGFDGYDGDRETDVETEHDAWGVGPE
jgi:bifunctional DNA-binding transcriptional regulator/antitoxin component of YhaV-PrlF toxin-antitoxin module